jgi:hypothetical protein
MEFDLARVIHRVVWSEGENWKKAFTIALGNGG